MKDIHQHLLVEGIVVSKNSLCVLICKCKITGSVADDRKKKQPQKFQDEHFHFVNDVMAENDELTSSQLYIVKPLITDFLKGGQPLYSGQNPCLRLLFL